MPPVNLYMRLQLAPALAAVTKLLGQVPRPARRAGPGRRSPGKLGAGTLGQTRTNRRHIDGALLKEGLNPFLRFRRAGVEREPVARMSHSEVPGQISPEIQLLFGVARDFRQRASQALGESRDSSVQLPAGDDLVDQAPGQRLGRGDLVAQEENLPGPPVSDDQRQPLSRARSRNAAPHRSDVADDDVVRSNREIAGQVELVAAAHNQAVETCDRGLTDIAQTVLRLDERPHPLPVVARFAHERRLLIQIGSGAKRAIPAAGENNNRDGIIPRRVLERAAHLSQRREVERVEHLGSIDGHARSGRLFLVEDVPKTKGLRRLRARPVHRSLYATWTYSKLT